MVLLSGTGGYRQSIVPLNKLFPLKKIKFEDQEFYTYNDYDFILKQSYGDYMTLPPEDQRKNHMANYINFEEGEYRINED